MNETAAACSNCLALLPLMPAKCALPSSNPHPAPAWAARVAAALVLRSLYQSMRRERLGLGRYLYKQGFPASQSCANSCWTSIESNKEHVSLQPELVHFVAMMKEPLAACWMASAGRKGFLCLAWLLQALVAWWLAGNEGEKQWQCQHHHLRPQITCLADLCPPLHPLLAECLQRDIRQHTGPEGLHKSH